MLPCVMSVPPSPPFTSDCWQKARPVKLVRAHAKVGSQLRLNWPSMALKSVLIHCFQVCLFCLYSCLSCCNLILQFTCLSELFLLTLSLSLFLCLSSALLLQFEYLMSALPLVTMHYFSALLRAHWLLSLPLTLPGLRPETDTISDSAVSHPSSLLCLSFHCSTSLSS